MPRRLTVLQVVPALETGGVERQTAALAVHLSRAGHRSLVMSAGGALEEAIRAGGAEPLRWGVGRKSPATLLLVPRLARFLREEGVDVVLAPSRLPAWVALGATRLLPRLARPALVTAVHGIHSVNRYSEVMTRGDLVVTVSATVTDYVRSRYPRADGARIREVRLGIDRDAFPRGYGPTPDWTARFRREHPALAGRRLVTLPARFTAWKGPLALLDLLRDLSRRGLAVAAAVCGEIPQRRARRASELLASARGEGLPLELLGHRADVRDVMASSAVVVSLSAPKPEAFGHSVVEALSLGVPVAGWDHGGVGEVLHDTFPEGAVPLLRTDLLADRVASFLESPPRVPPLSGYAIEETMRGMERVLEEAAQTRRT